MVSSYKTIKPNIAVRQKKTNHLLQLEVLLLYLT